MAGQARDLGFAPLPRRRNDKEAPAQLEHNQKEFQSNRPHRFGHDPLGSGQSAGLSDEELEGIKTGDSAHCWNEAEKLILKAADELHEDVFITDDTWTGLERHYSTQQIMDMVFTCGQYRMLAGALNSFGVQLDDDLVGL